jgi:hypothetical protein
MTSSTNSIRRLLVVGAAGAVAATVANAVIFGLGRAAGVDYLVKRGADGMSVHITDVASLSLMAFAVGLIAAAVSVRWGRPSLRSLQVLGAVLAVVSTYSDFTIEGAASATVTLAVMHLVVGVAYIASLQSVRITVPTAAVARSLRAATPVAV